MYTRTEKAKPRSRKQLGAYGEQFAAQYLSDILGWSIHERNWRCRSGEIDIVGISNRDIVLVEVRTKSINGKYGTALESVDARKLRQMQRVGHMYVSTLPSYFSEWSTRFDLIAIQVSGETVIDFRHYRNITY